ncbi:M48 family metallopeptidase [Cellulophaga sp. HaHaR_3_176]|uniref:M48 family metallopeptidase n=1 Tax=Cellulophaga sp. HaHaR_3_176 TaxID=1942464 RepID=UPI001C1F425E|nr:M48 family metallopeptidase [Cellulophaga sp. HaHaR_3_176]QWX82490.1 M48 family metallopeptidase [Cellulophaga sp. HaHaR_3_176]
MKKISLTLLLVMASLGANAQFGKLLKKGNVDAGEKLIKAATLSDDDMAALSLQSVIWMDENNPIAEAGDPYGDRLTKLVSDFENEDGLALNFKVYLVTDVNAFATPDGSVRVMAGLMDLMTDDEILSVIGHEIGHVKLGHSKERYKTAYKISAAKDLASANTNAGQVLADNEIGGFVENVLNAQFSQTNESESDKYGFEFMVRNDLNYHGMEGAFQKLADLSADGGKGSLTSSHPGSAKRSERAKEWADKEDAKNN